MVSVNTSKCAYIPATAQHTLVTVVAYVMVAVCGVCILTVMTLLLRRRYQSRCQRQRANSGSTSLIDQLDGDGSVELGLGEQELEEHES